MTFKYIISGTMFTLLSIMSVLYIVQQESVSAETGGDISVLYQEALEEVQRANHDADEASAASQKALTDARDLPYDPNTAEVRLDVVSLAEIAKDEAQRATAKAQSAEEYLKNKAYILSIESAQISQDIAGRAFMHVQEAARLIQNVLTQIETDQDILGDIESAFDDAVHARNEAVRAVDAAKSVPASSDTTILEEKAITIAQSALQHAEESNIHAKQARDAYTVNDLDAAMDAVVLSLGSSKKALQEVLSVTGLVEMILNEQESLLSSDKLDIRSSEALSDIRSTATTVEIDHELDQTISDTTVDITIDPADEGAENVELYAQKDGDVAEQYLGTGSEIDGRYTLPLNVQDRLPNGTYQLSAKIKNGDGTYSIRSGGRVHIKLDPKRGINAPFPEEIDSDGDGLANSEERRLRSDPFNPDSDGDGYLDGDELAGGFDPLRSSKLAEGDSVVYQTPKDKGEIKQEYQVNSIEFKRSDQQEKRLIFQGKALPNSFVTVYVYSDDPIIVVVRADEDGSWSYELDKDLDSGFHEVYVAVTDNTGKITAKSSPYRFIKTAEAVTRVSDSEEEIIQRALSNESPTERFRSNIMLYGIVLSVIFILLALGMIGFMTLRDQNEGITS